MPTKMNGWIKLDRSLMDDELFNERREYSKFEAWIDILTNVNYKDSKTMIGFDVVECKRGQCLFSIETWARRWHWHASKVRRFFDALKKCKKIEVEGLSKTTRITVCEYDSYEVSRRANDEQIGEQTTTTKEGKNKEKENIYTPPASPQVDQPAQLANPETKTLPAQKPKAKKKKDPEQEELAELEEAMAEEWHNYKNYLHKYWPRVSKMKEQMRPKQFAQLYREYGALDVKRIHDQMENYKKLDSYISVYRTANNWLARNKANRIAYGQRAHA